MRAALAVLVLVTCAPVASPPPTPASTTASTAARSTATPTAPFASPRSLRSPRPLPPVELPSLALTYERFTDIPVTRGPELLVTSDGQVVAAPSFGTRLTARRLTPAGIEAVRRAVLETELFAQSRNLGRQALPGVSPRLNRGFETLAITIRVGDRDVRVSTFARDPDDGLYRWEPGREELLALATRLSDLSWLPADAWLDATPRPYAATFHRLYVETLRNVASPLVTVPVDDLWPFTTAPERFGEIVKLDPASAPNVAARCAVLTADDARLLGASIAAAGGPPYAPETRGVGGTFRWPAGSGEILLQLEPLLPHVAPTCTGVRRLAF